MNNQTKMHIQMIFVVIFSGLLAISLSSIAEYYNATKETRKIIFDITIYSGLPIYIIIKFGVPIIVFIRTTMKEQKVTNENEEHELLNLRKKQ
jgi:MFS-type transporter involved in bile tolerance (Atg22 family)